MTASGTTPPRQRDLLLVSIPFSDLSSAKVRPVVVLSNSAYNDVAPDLLVAGVTSNLVTRPYSVPLETKHLESGNLLHSSMIRCDKIFSVDRRIVKGIVARIDAPTFERIRQTVLELLANLDPR